MAWLNRMPIMTKHKHRSTSRGWLQFSITALLVATTICAILLAWWRDRTQLLRRLEVQIEQVVIERNMAIEAREMAEKSEQMARRRAAETQAALRAATSEQQSSQQVGKDGL